MVSHLKTAAACFVSLPLYVESLLLQFGGKKKTQAEPNCDPLSGKVVKSQLDFADSRSFQNLLDSKSCVVELCCTGETTPMAASTF